MPYKHCRQALLGALLLSTASMAFTAESEPLMTGATASMLANTCAGCHGTHGASAGPAIPTIAGISTDYFEEVMQGFRSGGVPSTIMGRIAKGFTDKEIRAIGDFYAKQPFVAAVQPFDIGKAKAGAKLHDKYCEKCHADGGASNEDDTGILLGQLTPYLRFTLADFKSGDREMGKKMKKRILQLIKREGDNGFDALLNFYATGKQ